MAAVERYGTSSNKLENSVRRQGKKESLNQRKTVVLCVRHKEYSPLNQFIAAEITLMTQ